ncbi:hypothetical protein [Thalassobius sp. I31.1]|uniref:hypothetical protein n=1 Tax=Thalassobius sp. I31.1 TaxID=2109912 RepID=UPI000D1B1E4B|nr:hypothetical protein [Thalassobius sp. I31.1]
MSDPVETARAAWGPELPEWVLRLAEECASSSQVKVAKQLSRSASLVNQVLKGKYKGDLNAVEACVRGVFMSGTVTCPELGAIPSNECQEWRKKSRNFGNANRLRVRMFRACNGCALNQKGH